MENTLQTIQILNSLFSFLALGVSLILHLIVYRGLLYRLSNSRVTQNILKFLVSLNFIGTILYLFLKQYLFIPHWIYLLLSPH